MNPGHETDPRQWAVLLLLLLGLVAPVSSTAQTPPAATGEDEVKFATQPIEVKPVSADIHIAKRLERILISTGWFEIPEVKVSEGIVFLDGTTLRKEYKDWAGELARNTKDVVAVVNRVRIVERSPWDFSAEVRTLRNLLREFVRALPLIGLGLLILIAFLFGALVCGRLARFILSRRVANPMLQEVGARVVGIFVLLVGIYVTLHVVGLSRLAVTVLGGTGVVGLVIGFAFRDIMENFLAGILISLRNPFQGGDLIEVAGHLGVVQKVTARGTVLMDLDGNHVQIPNSTIYKSTILNFTANPRRRLSFEVGIGYDNLIPRAQAVALGVLAAHDSVLEKPEPLVLVEKLAAATVNLRIMFWIDGNAFDANKMKSSVMRLVNRAFQDEGISMPDEEREVLFPEAVPVRMVEERETIKAEETVRPEAQATTEAAATVAEGGLTSQEENIREQARLSRVPEAGPNLLKGN
ncbi:MAG: mechanosensitive ion channel protein MscS [Desulfuromonas sp.]|uniref:mechanosensitive ion channel family protein n=1 Tax=Desulfuromonas sp. TaxID=892 RepID=UPI000CB2E5B3|nr:mechanosensitive ion channel family protein [Desulfuromonas sp.]PLX83333.1 MAG: mechanosensitive ion channel protein MscS [Desulfuromonas sp.]